MPISSAMRSIISSMANIACGWPGARIARGKPPLRLDVLVHLGDRAELVARRIANAAAAAAAAAGLAAAGRPDGAPRGDLAAAHLAVAARRRSSSTGCCPGGCRCRGALPCDCRSRGTGRLNFLLSWAASTPSLSAPNLAAESAADVLAVELDLVGPQLQLAGQVVAERLVALRRAVRHGRVAAEMDDGAVRLRGSSAFAPASGTRPRRRLRSRRALSALRRRSRPASSSAAGVRSSSSRVRGQRARRTAGRAPRAHPRAPAATRRRCGRCGRRGSGPPPCRARTSSTPFTALAASTFEPRSRGVAEVGADVRRPQHLRQVVVGRVLGRAAHLFDDVERAAASFSRHTRLSSLVAHRRPPFAAASTASKIRT